MRDKSNQELSSEGIDVQKNDSPLMRHLKLVKHCIFQVENYFFGEFVVEKWGNVLGPIECVVENDFIEKWF